MRNITAAELIARDNIIIMNCCGAHLVFRTVEHSLKSSFVYYIVSLACFYTSPHSRLPNINIYVYIHTLNTIYYVFLYTHTLYTHVYTYVRENDTP